MVILLLCCASLFFSCGLKQGLTTNNTKTFSLPISKKVKHHYVDFQAEFKKILNKKRSLLPYLDLINNVYRKADYQPVLVPKFLPQNQLQLLVDYLERSNEHGLDQNLFFISDIKEKLAAVNAFIPTDTLSKPIDTLRRYQKLTKLELAVAGAMIKYSMILQFGLVDPEKVYAQYSTPTLQPDSNAVLHVFEVKDLKNYLDSIQPKTSAYIALQKALFAINRDSSTSSVDLRNTLVVNMERLRWQNRPKEHKFVSVNIADFSLDVINKGKSVLHMKVCVGEKGQRETPQLGSMIFRIQVNPVWNVPQSIARDEISKHAAQDRFYLANNNINVYKKGVLIQDPESIDWGSENIDQYSFQQQPGPENALGKIKFLFNNESSVYLHDTPLQKIFNQPMRAVSHGCVRVQKPLELAYALFGKDKKYQLIKRAMETGYPRAKFIDLPQQIPIRLNYYTAGIDAHNTVQYYKDIYDLDPILYHAINIQSLSQL